MGGEGKLRCSFLISLSVISGCMTTDELENHEQSICIRIEGCGYGTKAYDPDEDLIKDLTLFIFDEEGLLEERADIRTDGSSEGLYHETSLLRNKRYSIYACANFGTHIHLEELSQIEGLKFHLVYPDEYREGMPMTGKVEDTLIDETTDEIRISLERLMAKISLRIDRGGLSEGIGFRVISARIGNCPKQSKAFGDNKIDNPDYLFDVGFKRDEDECIPLNRNAGNGVSAGISLYMLENKQGLFSPEGISDDSYKVFDRNDVRQEVCSYIELEIDYSSDILHTVSRPLVYRFYLGEDRNSLDIERNCHYRITVIPQDDGLSGDGWRVDKSGLEDINGKTSFEMTPSGYIQGDIGDSIHVRCRYHPSEAPFNIGLEELESDRERGLYDYRIDDDGLGVMLYLKNPGRGIIYMEAGEPVNETGILMVEINNI